MSDPALSIIVDSAGAEAGAKRVQSALQAIQKSAADTIAAIEALNKAQKSSGKGGTSGVDAGAKAAVKAHEQAEQQKTAITKREAAKRAALQDNPQVGKIKAEMDSIKAAMAKIPAPKADLSGLISQIEKINQTLSRMASPRVDFSAVRQQVAGLSRDLKDLGTINLSGLETSGAAAINALQQRVAALSRQIAALNGIEVKQPAPPPVSPRRAVDASDPAPNRPVAPPPPPAVPVVEPRRPAAPAPNPGETAVKPSNQPKPVPQVKAPKIAPSNPQLNGLKIEVDNLNRSLSRMASPRISTASIQRDIKALDRDINKIAKADLTKMTDGGAAGIAKIRDRAAELTRHLKAVQKEGVLAGNLMGGDAPGPITKSQASAQRAQDARRRTQFSSVPETSPSFVGPVSPKAYQAQVAAVQAAESAKTKIFEAEAAKQTAIWDRNAREQQKHTERLKKEAADADRYRRSQMAPASSASFVGPMPESNTQRLQRLTTQLPPASSPNFVGPMPAKASDLKNVTTEADRLKKKLEDLRKTGGPTASLKGGYQELARTFDGLTSAVNMGRAAMVAYGAVGAVREAVLMADGFMSLTQRVKSATEASGDFLVMNKQLFDMAQKNGVAFRDTVGVWQNLSRAAPELGATNDDMLRLTDIVQKLGTIGGSTGDELRYALRQFGQAMSMGTLRAEEMNSLLENTPEIANAIARGMGKTTGQLRMAVLEGKVLSKDVFQALMKQGDQIDDKFGRIAPTIAQGVNRIQNALSKSLGENSGGMTTELAKGMTLLADNMDTVLNTAASLGVVLAGVFGGRIAGAMAKSAWDAGAALKSQAVDMKKLGEEAVKTAAATASFARSQETAAKLAVASAATRVDTARQNQAGAMIAVATAPPDDKRKAYSKFDAADKELAEAQKDLADKHIAVGVATDNSAKATAALSAAQKAATVTSRVWAGVMTGLSAVVGALGGPVGVLITALSVGFSLYASNTKSAGDSQREFNDLLVKFIDLQKTLENTDVTGSAREAALASQRNIIASLDADIKRAETRIQSLKERPDFQVLSGALGTLDSLDKAAGFKTGDSPKAAQDLFSGTDSKEIAQKRAQRSTLDVMSNEKAYEDSFMRGIPKPIPVVVEDKATIKFKQITGELNRTIRAQRELNAAILAGAANAAAFRQQMQIDDEIANIPKDMSPDRQDELAEQIRAKAQQTQIVEQNETQMQIDDEVKGQKEIARAMGGGPPAARKAEARVAARSAADALGYIGDGSALDKDPDGSKRKALEKSYLAQADAQTAGDFASEARGSTIGLKAEEKKLQAMQKVGIAREVEMARIEKEAELISQFGSAAGKGAQKMIEQAGAAAKLRAEGELLGMAMDEQNKAVGATKLVETADFEGEDRNSKTAMLEKRIELEGRYGDVLDENAEKIIQAIGVQQEMDDLRAQKNDLRDARMDTAGIEEQIKLMQDLGVENRVEMAGLQKSIELKKQYGAATSDVAKMLIEEAKNQERLNIAREKEAALMSMQRETKAIGDVGKITLDPKLGNEERARAIAMREKELELMNQYGSVSDANSQMMIAEAGNQAALTEYINQHNDALAQMAMQGRDSYGMLRDAAAVGLGGMENMLVDLITKSGSAKEAFANFAKSVGEQLIRLAIQMMIIKPLAGMLMGGLAGPGVAMAAPSADFVGPMPLAGGLHSGGIVGSETSGMRPMTSIFSGLPKYHSGGIVGNEQPAILKRGEGVFTEGQMKALAPSGGGGSVNAPITVNVSQPPGADQEQGDRFGKAISKQISAAMDAHLQRAMRNGGTLNPNGMR